ncbi:hypothetical protein G6O69_05875 [Pseudenhygromyxa sp. WMMC2535]|uniref:hypothetical protein n=1 Tax=Pseudenhygromyxa sp. WMMC2535 TaxID=2712867 RepID=UPI0015958732|nr:hypothetical protein [Pseudenhygromyxa sp. WMMC2535]NVB37351.1 hypothetical protein [Pseudenhygromyxa sp. WMMC2535]
MTDFFGTVHCVHRGISGNIIWASSFNRPSGTQGSWSEWRDTGLRSAAEPALVGYRDKNVDASVRNQLLMAFRGE